VTSRHSRTSQSSEKMMIESTQGIAGGAKEWAILTDSPLKKNK